VYKWSAFNMKQRLLKTRWQNKTDSHSDFTIMQTMLSCSHIYFLFLLTLHISYLSYISKVFQVKCNRPIIKEFLK